MATARTNGESDIREDLDRLREDIAALTKDVRAAASRGGEEVASGARAAAREARAKVEEVGDKASAMISERPLTSLIAAFFIGLVLGKLAQR